MSGMGKNNLQMYELQGRILAFNLSKIYVSNQQLIYELWRP